MIPVLVSLPWAVLCGGLLYALVRKDDIAAREREVLCQRIQAPDVAVAQHVDATVDGPNGLGYVPVDNDDAWYEDLQEQVNGA